MSGLNINAGFYNNPQTPESVLGQNLQISIQVFWFTTGYVHITKEKINIYDWIYNICMKVMMYE